MRCGDENIEKEIDQTIQKIINEMKSIKPSSVKNENVDV